MGSFRFHLTIRGASGKKGALQICRKLRNRVFLGCCGRKKSSIK